MISAGIGKSDILRCIALIQVNTLFESISNQWVESIEKAWGLGGFLRWTSDQELGKH